MSLDTVQDIALFTSKAMLCEVFEFCIQRCIWTMSCNMHCRVNILLLILTWRTFLNKLFKNATRNYVVSIRLWLFKAYYVNYFTYE